MSRVYQRGDGGIYWADYTDARGKRRRRSTKCTVKDAADATLTRWVREAELQKAGVQPINVEHLRTPLVSHIDQWLSALAILRRDQDYIDKADRELKKLATRFRWTSLGDLTPEGIDEALHKIRAENKAKTTNNKRGYLSSFIKWCVKRRRLVENVLITPEFDLNDSVRRRPLKLQEEVHKLLTCLEIPVARRTFYRAMIGTGLRHGEARQLLVSSVRLDSSCPHLYLPACITKSGADEPALLSDEMQRVFRRLIAGKDALMNVFDTIPDNRRFQKDLLLCGIESVDHRGRVATLHSLRHTFVTLLRRHGALLEEAMDVARHRSIKETRGYSDEDEVMLPRMAVVGRMPPLLPMSRATVAANVPVLPAAGRTAFETSAVPTTRHTPEDGMCLVSMRPRGVEPPCNVGEHDAIWQECPGGVPAGVPRPWAVPDTAEGRARVIDELRLGTAAAYMRGGMFVVVDIPQEPQAQAATAPAVEAAGGAA